MRIKLCMALIALLSSAALLAAYLMQHYLHMEPCTYCVLIRYGLAIALMMSLLFGCVSRVASQRCYDILLMPIGLVAASSAWLSYRLVVPSEGCGKDALAVMLSQWPPAQYLPSMFNVTGLCGDTNAYFQNIHLAHWSLGLSVVLVLVWLYGRFGRNRSLLKAEKAALAA